jgi:hypothetical protein
MGEAGEPWTLLNDHQLKGCGRWDRTQRTCMTAMTSIRRSDIPVQARLVLDDDEWPEHPQRATLNLWVPPPSGLSKAAEEEAVRRAAIAFLERALDTLRTPPPVKG